MPRPRAVLIWIAVATALLVPFGFAVSSPLLQWRDPVYIGSGIAGVMAMGLLLMQPLLVGGYLPGFKGISGRRLHRGVGALLVGLVIIHVAGLWITSPPDVIDALLFMSPTPFSIWGVIAMWAVFAAALIGALRHRMGQRLRLWRLLHTSLVSIIAIGTALHALQIDGTMEPISKGLLTALVLGVLIWVILDRRIWVLFPLVRRK